MGSVAVGCGGVAGEAEGELGGFVDGVDDGAVGGDGAGEDLALLEEADVFYVAVEVVGEHVQHAGDEGGAEKAGLFGEGVFHGDGLWGNASLATIELSRYMGHPVRLVEEAASWWEAKVLEMDSL